MPQKLQSGQGFVYVLTNEAMPGYVKIGKTRSSVKQRILGLSRSSAVPLPFECYYAVRVADFGKVEKALHEALGDLRKNPHREFFNISPERVVAILKLLAIEEVTLPRNIGVKTKADADALRQAKERSRRKRPAFNFKMVKIPAGAGLRFVRDPAITCKVAPDQKNVEFKGQMMSLTKAARRALRTKSSLQGPIYWTYKGKILDEMRQDILEQPQARAASQV